MYDVEIRELRRAAYVSAQREQRQAITHTWAQTLLYKTLRDRYEHATPELRAAGFDRQWARFERFYTGWKEARR